MHKILYNGENADEILEFIRNHTPQEKIHFKLHLTSTNAIRIRFLNRAYTIYLESGDYLIFLKNSQMYDIAFA